MSYFFILEQSKMSDKVTKNFKQSFKNLNNTISTSNLKDVKPIKAETVSPEEMFDVKSFTDGDIDEQTSTGSVGGSYVGPLFSSPIKRSSLFAPKGSPEHKEGKKVLKQMEKPIGKIYSKKDLQEVFMSEEEVDESTTTASVGGSYVGPAMWPKDKSNWRGGAKTQVPGGKFVKVKSKCKEYPYCDEGPGAIELSNTSNEEIDSVFSEGKSTYDMTEDEMWYSRDSDYLKLIEIIESVKNLRQFPAIKKLWELFQQKFDGYLSEYLINHIEGVIEQKYDELTNNQRTSNDMMSESKKEKPSEEQKLKDYDKVIKTIKSVDNIKQFNSALKMWVNIRVKYNDEFSDKEMEGFKNEMHKKIEELRQTKKDIQENKSLYRKLD